MCQPGNASGSLGQRLGIQRRTLPCVWPPPVTRPGRPDKTGLFITQKVGFNGVGKPVDCFGKTVDNPKIVCTL